MEALNDEKKEREALDVVSSDHSRQREVQPIPSGTFLKILRIKNGLSKKLLFKLEKR